MSCVNQVSRVTVLGATGSVGRNTCEVIQRTGQQLVGLAAGRDVAGLAELCRTYQPAQAALADEQAAAALATELADCATVVTGGEAAVTALAAGTADTVVAAIAGVAGVASTLAAVQAGKRVLLANKEALIVAGPQLLVDCVAQGGEIVPVDSEHSSLLELLHLARDRRATIARVWLTASGGPFRELASLEAVTPAMACAHPVWRMGPKISVDSATLMNKGLEVIEACYLFDLAPEQVEVVIHPQAIVHAIVEFDDGSSIAHCGPPDMRSAIARALAWPAPATCSFGRVDWPALGQLEFSAPDLGRFPSLRLAREAVIAGGTAPAVLNAANEVAVTSFVNGSGLRFVDIPVVVAETLAATASATSPSIADLLAADSAAREIAAQQVHALTC